jgi:hypothetical protein
MRRLLRGCRYNEDEVMSVEERLSSTGVKPVRTWCWVVRREAIFLASSGLLSMIAITSDAGSSPCLARCSRASVELTSNDGVTRHVPDGDCRTGFRGVMHAGWGAPRAGRRAGRPSWRKTADRPNRRSLSLPLNRTDARRHKQLRPESETESLFSLFCALPSPPGSVS